MSDLATVQAVAAALLDHSHSETRVIVIKNLIKLGFLPTDLYPVNPLPADYSYPRKDSSQLNPAWDLDPEEKRAITPVDHRGSVTVSPGSWRGLPGDPKAFAPGNAPIVSGSVVAPRDGATNGLAQNRLEARHAIEELRHNLAVWYRGLNEAQKRRVRRFVGARKAFK